MQCLAVLTEVNHRLGALVRRIIQRSTWW